MNDHPLTEEFLTEAYMPLLMLPGEPELTPAHYAFLLVLFTQEGVTCLEFEAAVGAVMKTETFFPPPAKLLEQVQRIRKERRVDQVREERLKLEAAKPVRKPTGYGAPITGAYVPPHLRDQLTTPADPDNRDARGPRRAF